ncbi:50S ribosomal protein L11 methyltransferase [Asticcacaulis sp. AND118]|uniref:50S ribosomal protein L11 methyltransferase n=1 Tax=Asticcacaulis sp. AND118 TaxID=2840468 RepID=UPI001CFFCBA8|nr:50S ribosomal protein L11 methyltransferase [Asticcacaulis sp. AND118]UDF05002.1 50S ribosomal protein L11 methyltransferase [Asticcacaulis sp. AND118]
MLSRWRYLFFARQWEAAFVTAGQPMIHAEYGFDLRLEPGVYPTHPDFTYSTSMILQGLPDDLSGKTLLDVGTGCGAIAIAAARRGAKVHAVDIDPAAVALARRNVAANGVANRVTLSEGKVLQFASAPDVPERFDYIAANLWFPIRLWGFNQEHHSLMRVQKRFLSQVFGLLAPGGQALLASGAFADSRGIRDLFAEAGLTPDITTRRAWHNGGRIAVNWHLYRF